MLILIDPIDEVWVDQAPEFDGRTLRSIAKGQVDLDAAEQGEDEGKAQAQTQEEFAPLLEFLAEALTDKVRSARLSTRLTDSPACLVGDTHDLTPALEKLYRAMGQPVPHTKRILEVNAAHPLIAGLRAAQAAQAENLGQSAELLYGLALLAEGGELEDPARFSRLIADRLAPTV